MCGGWNRSLCYWVLPMRTYHVHWLYYTDHVIAVGWKSKGHDDIRCDGKLGPLVHLQNPPCKMSGYQHKVSPSLNRFFYLPSWFNAGAKVALPFHLISWSKVPRSGQSHANLVITKFISTLSIVGISTKIWGRRWDTVAHSCKVLSCPLHQYEPCYFFGCILVEVFLFCKS
jgi:hypothetical protein